MFLELLGPDDPDRFALLPVLGLVAVHLVDRGVAVASDGHVTFFENLVKFVKKNYIFNFVNNEVFQLFNNSKNCIRNVRNISSLNSINVFPQINCPFFRNYVCFNFVNVEQVIGC